MLFHFISVTAIVAKFINYETSSAEDNNVII